jgi:hypothetical protein
MTHFFDNAVLISMCKDDHLANDDRCSCAGHGGYRKKTFPEKLGKNKNQFSIKGSAKIPEVLRMGCFLYLKLRFRCHDHTPSPSPTGILGPISEPSISFPTFLYPASRYITAEDCSDHSLRPIFTRRRDHLWPLGTNHILPDQS